MAIFVSDTLVKTFQQSHADYKSLVCIIKVELTDNSMCAKQLQLWRYPFQTCRKDVV